MIILVGIMSFLAASAVRWWMTRTYARWSKVPNRVGTNGYTIARHILDNNQLQHVKLEESNGQLSDHYIPSQNLLRLSPAINTQASVAAMAVAAHECGHAIQDARGYAPLKAKALLMPVASIANQLGLLLTIGSGFIGNSFLLNVGMSMIGMGILMQLITLPIEFDASKRALQELSRLDLVEPAEYAGAKKMLIAAALTYVTSAASSLAMLAVFTVSMFRRR